MPAKKKTKRVRAARMSPQARREQILDTAAALIVKRGLLSCTLEETAAQAGISKPLIYKYFARREDLLKELLAREYSYLRQSRIGLSNGDGGFEPMVQRGFRRVFEYLYERGPILPLMASDPTVRKLVRNREDKNRAAAIKSTASRGQAQYGVPSDVALIAAMISANAPIMSARFLKDSKIPADEAADVWAEFTLGGWKALSKRFNGREARKANGSRAVRANHRIAVEHGRHAA